MSDKIEVKAYKTKELAARYEMTEKVFNVQIKPFKKDLGKRVGQYYNPKQVAMIFKKLGVPGTRDEKDVNP